MTYTVDKVPCKSCPYRRDVPSGLWHSNEYKKLPGYDGDAIHQITEGGTAVFECHQLNGKLCAGWLGCHGPFNLIALRLTRKKIARAVFKYVSPIPLFASGAEACVHGMRDLKRPGERARRMIDTLLRKRERRLAKEKEDSHGRHRQHQR